MLEAEVSVFLKKRKLKSPGSIPIKAMHMQQYSCDYESRLVLGKLLK